MKAIVVHEFGGLEVLKFEKSPRQTRRRTGSRPRPRRRCESLRHYMRAGTYASAAASLQRPDRMPRE